MLHVACTLRRACVPCMFARMFLREAPQARLPRLPHPSSSHPPRSRGDGPRFQMGQGCRAAPSRHHILARAKAGIPGSPLPARGPLANPCLQAMARKWGMVIVSPILERDASHRETIWNTAVVIGNNGNVIGKHRKVGLGGLAAVAALCCSSCSSW